jgi:hypothetical protein
VSYVIGYNFLTAEAVLVIAFTLPPTPYFSILLLLFTFTIKIYIFFCPSLFRSLETCHAGLVFTETASFLSRSSYYLRKSSRIHILRLFSNLFKYIMKTLKTLSFLELLFSVFSAKQSIIRVEKKK